ncbi:tail fiber protein, partial [Rodentibacter rarus]|uniref:tail fiber protein n=1 Tax=Rodentibacter rarus TaxID=1908260 RepID=UPI0015C3BAAA
MQLKLIDLFSSIRWAKNGDLTDFSQTNYEAGWAHLGDDTPTVQDFNYVQAMNDQKDQWLFAQINEVLKAQGIEATEDDLPALKRAIENLVTAKSTPKTITSTTKNVFDDNGHSHEIDRATTAKAGIVQLNSATNSSSETEAATPKAVKTVKDRLDSVSRNQANYIPNSKKSNAVDSASSDTVATSAAVKTVNDKVTLLNFYKVNVKAGNTPVTFDLSNREHWIAEIGSVYKGTGHYQLGL